MKISIFLFFLFTYQLLSNEIGEKRYNLSIAATFKNEAKYLTEWIEYHRLIGVDHFYLYNVESEDSFLTVLKNYIEDHSVTLVQWRDMAKREGEPYFWSLGTQIPAYENAILRAKDESNWLIFLEVNEFLVLPHSFDFLELMKAHRAYPAITLTAESFDAISSDPGEKKLIIESVTLTKTHKPHPQKEVSKTIFNPALCEGFTWPPYQASFKGGQTEVSLINKPIRIHRYLNRGLKVSGEKRPKIYADLQTMPERVRSDFLDLNYMIEDQGSCMRRFVPELIERMGRQQ